MIEQILGWLGTICFFYGVWALGSKNISGFYANSIANILYAIQGCIMGNYPLVVCSIGLLIFNIYGIKQWSKNVYYYVQR